MRKSIVALLVLLVMAAGAFGGWYFWHKTYGQPLQLAAAEYTLKQIMKAPDTFKILSARFKVDDGQPIILIEYSSKNPMGVPIRGIAKFVYSAVPIDRISDTPDALEKMQLEMMRTNFKAINAGKKVVGPFDHSYLSSIQLGDSMNAREESLLKAMYSLAMINLNKQFPPRSEIGGRIEEVDEATGRILKMSPRRFSRGYIPSEIFPWEN